MLWIPSLVVIGCLPSILLLALLTVEWNPNVPMSAQVGETMVTALFVATLAAPFAVAQLGALAMVGR